MTQPFGPVKGATRSIGLHGQVTAGTVAAALTVIAARHSVLRSRVVERDAGPMLEVGPLRPVPVDEVDLRGQPDLLGKTRASATRQVFDLTAGLPLVRATLVRLDDAAELIVVADHLAFDGGSVGPLLRELAAALAGKPVVTPALQLGDLAGPALDSGFWPGELAGATLPDDLPGRPGAELPDSTRIDVPLDARMRRDLGDFAARCGVTPFAVYLAALGLVTGGLSGQDDIVIGAPAAGRHVRGAQELIGPLLEVLPLRVRMAASDTFRSLVTRCAEVTTRALAHQGEDALAQLPARGTPVLLAMQDDEIVVERADFRLELLTDLSSGAAPNELTVFVGGDRLRVEYRVHRFDAGFVSGFTDRLLGSLRAGLADPDRFLSTVDLVSAGERDSLLRMASGADLPAEVPDRGAQGDRGRRAVAGCGGGVRARWVDDLRGVGCVVGAGGGGIGVVGSSAGGRRRDLPAARPPGAGGDAGGVAGRGRVPAAGSRSSGGTVGVPGIRRRGSVGPRPVGGAAAFGIGAAA